MKRLSRRVVQTIALIGFVALAMGMYVALELSSDMLARVLLGALVVLMLGIISSS